MKTNQHSASDDDIGKLHKLVTKGYTLLTKSQIEKYEETIRKAKEEGISDEDKQSLMDELQFIIDSRDLNAAAKWVAANDMGSVPAEEDETSELSKELKEMQDRHRNNVISLLRDGTNG